MAQGSTIDDSGGLYTPDYGQQSWQDALAQKNAIAMQYPVDQSNGLHYSIVNGKKRYFEPIMTPQQYLDWSKQNGEGLLHNAAEWNPDTGKYEQSIDWLKAATLIGGGADAAVTGAAFAGAGAAGGAGGGSGAAGGGGTTLASLGSSGAATGGAGAAGATTAGAGGAGVAGAAGPFSTFIHAAAPTLIGGGLNLLGSYLQSRAQGNATDAEIAAQKEMLQEQLAAQREALGIQTQEYNQNMGLNVNQANQRTQAYNTTLANLAPYRGIGNAAVSMSGYALGLPGYETGNRTVVNAPPPSQPVAPLIVPDPITMPSSTTSGAPPTNTPQQPQTPQPQAPQNTSSQMPSVGEQRVINGQNAVWDGRGWKAA